MGLHASLTAEVTLDNCQVPVENRLGGEEQGASIAFQGLDNSRIGIAAQAVGLSQRAIDEAVHFVLSQYVTSITSSSDIRIAKMMIDAAERYIPMDKEEQRKLLLKAAKYTPLFPRKQG